MNVPLVGSSAALVTIDGSLNRARARVRLGKLSTAAIVIYGTLAAALLANPRPVAAWLDEFEPGPVVDMARAGTERVVAVSDRLGLATLSDAVRHRMKAAMHRPLGSS